MKSKVFLDMDGVLVDLYKVIINLSGKKSHKDISIDDFFKIMLSNDVYEFFKALPEFKSNNIVEMTQDIKSIIYIIGPISFMCKNLKIKKKTIMRLFLKKNLKLL